MARALSLALCLALFTITRCAACKLDQCTRIYNMKLEEEGIPGPEATPAFCSVLSAYGHCVHATTRSCRGNLKFHTTVSLLNPLKVRFNCTKHTGPHSHRPLPPPQAAPPPPPPPAACTFHGRNRFRHCGLFGDPHLKTFNNEYQTCRVRGAWPLIDNPYLAVQVTNDPVLDGSLATATTKVTIIIKGRSTPCTTEKTYEATADTALPATFIDGTNRSGPDQSVVIASSQGAATSGAARERVEIYLRYIETTLVVRRVGKYLAFSAKLPEELVENSQGEENLQLCRRGCPPLERLDLVRARGHVVSWEEALQQCRDTGDLSNDIVNNLTDYYLDWCVFDAMTAGVGSEFTAAAHSAQADVLRMDPASLQNRTAPLQLSQPAPSAAPAAAPSPLHRLLLVSLVLLAGVRPLMVH